MIENIFLGNEQASRGIINWEEVHRRAVDLMARVGLNDLPEMPVNKMGVGKQQLVEIAKALAKDVRLLILDEPTAALNDDSEKLLELRERLGMRAIIISHKLNEVTRVADKITVIRDGCTIETLEKNVDEITGERIIQGMVGRAITDRYPPRENQKIGEVCLEVRDWCVESPYIAGRQVVDHVNLRLRRGEVVGIAGLMGAGRTELAMSIFGKSYGRNITGTILKDGKEIQVNSVGEAIANGIAYVTEDRKGQGLILGQTIRENISLPTLRRLSSRGVIRIVEAVVFDAELLHELDTCIHLCPCVLDCARLCVEGLVRRSCTEHMPHIAAYNDMIVWKCRFFLHKSVKKTISLLPH